MGKQSSMVRLSDAQRVLLKYRGQFAQYDGVTEISVARNSVGVISFIVTCNSLEAAKRLPRVDAIEDLPVCIQVKDVSERVAASSS